MEKEFCLHDYEDSTFDLESLYRGVKDIRGHLQAMLKLGRHGLYFHLLGSFSL